MRRQATRPARSLYAGAQADIIFLTLSRWYRGIFGTKNSEPGRSVASVSVLTRVDGQRAGADTIVGEGRCISSCRLLQPQQSWSRRQRLRRQKNGTWRRAFPDNNFHTKNIREFIAKIKGGTKELDIVLHTNQSLFKLQDSKKAVQSGQVPMAELLLVQFGNEDPIYEISAIPFLADTVEKAQKLWSVSRGPLSERLAKDGIRLLYGVTWPVQGFYAKTPITSVANFKGVKMRTYSAMTGRMAEEMGAIPTNVVFSEIPQAFSTGLVSTMYTSPATGVDTQAWDYTKYFMNVGGNFTMNVVIANERVLPPPGCRNTEGRDGCGGGGGDARLEDELDVTAEHLKLMADKGMTISTPDAKFRRRAAARRQDPHCGMAEEGRTGRREDHRRLSQAIGRSEARSADGLPGGRAASGGACVRRWTCCIWPAALSAAFSWR